MASDQPRTGTPVAGSPQCGPSEPQASEVLVSLVRKVRISLVSGDVVGRSADGGDQLLLVGLGPLWSATKSGPSSLLLETRSTERWLVRISEASGLVAAIEPVP